MKPRRVCVICGAPVEPAFACRQSKAGKPFTCRACTLKAEVDRRKAYVERKRVEFGDRRCAVCGEPVAWRDSFAKRNKKYFPVTCSKKCSSELAARGRRLVKAEVIDKIKAYIKAKGRYVKYIDVLKGTHYTSAEMGKLGISIKELNKEVLGMDVTGPEIADAEAYDVHVLSFAELCDAYGLRAENVRQLVHAYRLSGRYKYNNLTCCFFTDVCLHLIHTAGQYLGLVKLAELLGVSRERFTNCAVDVDHLNRLLGHRSYVGSSYFEELAYRTLLDFFAREDISRQHVFSDCRSVCGHRLEFDFYIPKQKLFIEIDGSQHHDKQSGLYTDKLQANDALKDAYASSLGYTMLRVSTVPQDTFVARLREQVLGILKPVELLEPRPDNAEGNQQPSPEKPHQLMLFQEGPETIERG